MSDPVELSVVLPAHDEEAAIEGVIRDVVATVRSLAPGASEVLVVDDGSTDATGQILDRLAAELAEVEVVHQRPNYGHGPALLTGFARARGAWVGHLDTDDQIPADQLAQLWTRRAGADLVLGVRVARDDPRHRLVVTKVLRFLVGRFAGRPIRDANVPCKLISRDLLEEALPLLPADTFAPSVGLAVVAARRGRTIVEVPVVHQARPHGESSLKPLRLVSALVTSTRQTAALARSLR
ncbi:MAG TPA: glycosyltransferase family 2 protein [Acidimicrobiales bacterium]|nr:glycosyltransferase family 2 protein [Acidimicrobiales bacterium]